MGTTQEVPGSFMGGFVAGIPHLIIGENHAWGYGGPLTGVRLASVYISEIIPANDREQGGKWLEGVKNGGPGIPHSNDA